jgi:hypothetical protein
MLFGEKCNFLERKKIALFAERSEWGNFEQNPTE